MLPGVGRLSSSSTHLLMSFFSPSPRVVLCYLLFPSSFTLARQTFDCRFEYKNVFEPPLLGYPPSNCSYYKSTEAREWLPKAYLHNAVCACSMGVDCPSANCVREYLLIYTENYQSYTKDKAVYLKANRPIAYANFVQTHIVSLLYTFHVDAYSFCGCNSGPAPYPVWKILVRTAAS